MHEQTDRRKLSRLELAKAIFLKSKGDCTNRCIKQSEDSEGREGEAAGEIHQQHMTERKLNLLSLVSFCRKLCRHRQPS